MYLLARWGIYFIWPFLHWIACQLSQGSRVTLGVLRVLIMSCRQWPKMLYALRSAFTTPWSIGSPRSEKAVTWRPRATVWSVKRRSGRRVEDFQSLENHKSRGKWQELLYKIILEREFQSCILKKLRLTDMVLGDHLDCYIITCYQFVEFVFEGSPGPLSNELSGLGPTCSR